MSSRFKQILVASAVSAGTCLLPVAPAHASSASTFAEFYDDANFVGSSYYDSGDGGQCFNLPAQWLRRISSVHANTRWTLYSFGNCWVEPGYPTLDHNGDMSYVGDAMNDRAQSVRVY